MAEDVVIARGEVTILSDYLLTRLTCTVKDVLIDTPVWAGHLGVYRVYRFRQVYVAI